MSEWLVAARKRRAREAEKCRRSAAHFAQYALRNERDGTVIKNAPFHLEWHEFLDANPMGVIIAPVEHGKTMQIGVCKPLWLLGTEPESRGAIISNTAAQAEKILRAITTNIQHNPCVKEVFPKLKRSTRTQDAWHSNSITVERKTIAKDPSIQALGVGGPLVGSRLDWVILDDVLDFENTRTMDQIQKLIDWFDTTLYTRLVDGGRCWAIGTPWHPSDLLHSLAERPAFKSMRRGAVHNPLDDPQQWEPLWFSKERLLEIQANTNPHNFSRKYLCEVTTDASGRFQSDWIDRCLAVGRGRTLVDRAPKTPGGREYPCFTGVDLGVGQGEQHDLTVLFTIAIDDDNRRMVCDIQSGRWTAPEIIDRVRDVQNRFNSLVIVEDNGAQRFFLQWAGSEGLRVVPFTTTGKRKHDESFGIESLAVEMRNAQWVIPSGMSGQDRAPEVDAWIREMLFYSPEHHTGDRLMASWFARESARKLERGITQRSDYMSR